MRKSGGIRFRVEQKRGVALTLDDMWTLRARMAEATYFFKCFDREQIGIRAPQDEQGHGAQTVELRPECLKRLFEIEAFERSFIRLRS